MKVDIKYVNGILMFMHDDEVDVSFDVSKRSAIEILELLKTSVTNKNGAQGIVDTYHFGFTIQNDILTMIVCEAGKSGEDTLCELRYSLTHDTVPTSVNISNIMKRLTTEIEAEDYDHALGVEYLFGLKFRIMDSNSSCMYTRITLDISKEDSVKLLNTIVQCELNCESQMDYRVGKYNIDIVPLAQISVAKVRDTWLNIVVKNTSGGILCDMKVNRFIGKTTIVNGLTNVKRNISAVLLNN